MNLLFLFFLAIVITFAYAGIRGAPWVPTRKQDVERFLKLANIQPGQKMYDLGCGDGRLVCVAGEAGAQAEGLELSLLPYLLASARRLFQKNKKNIKISFRDIWHKDLSDADVVYFFLMPDIYPKLKQKLEKELKKGTKVIGYVWPVVGWEPIQADVIEGRYKMFLYQI